MTPLSAMTGELTPDSASTLDNAHYIGPDQANPANPERPDFDGTTSNIGATHCGHCISPLFNIDDANIEFVSVIGLEHICDILPPVSHDGAQHKKPPKPNHLV